MKNTASSNITYQQHTFANVPGPSVQRSAFNRSFNYKTTIDVGKLYPVFVDEMLPGDTINITATFLCRGATFIFPVMDNIYLDFHMWAVPNRLVWTNWKKFQGEQVNPGDSTVYTVPQLVSPTGGFARYGMADYFGIPPQATPGNTHSVNALPFRAALLIWNEFYRDQNLQNSLVIPTGDGPDAESSFPMLTRQKRHDYITSALPFAQKGVQVSLPLGTTAPVNFSSTVFNNGIIKKASDHTLIGGANSQLSRTGVTGVLTDGAANNLVYDPNGTLYADLSAASAATINQLRTTIQMQRLQERDARSGTRYQEALLARFGVTSPDARMQRPEFLGGGTINISVNAVPQTSSTTGSLPQGRLSAYSHGMGQAVGISKSFTEHEYVIGFVNVRADLNYQNGTERMWNRQTRYDFFEPVLAHLGEQAILNEEVYTSGIPVADNAVFGYQERWAEYRYKPSRITGKFRSTDPTPLDSWHLAQNFVSLPVLNASFIVDAPPTTRVMAVTTEPPFLLDCHYNMKHVRPMPTYSVPGMMDHF